MDFDKLLYYFFQGCCTNAYDYFGAHVEAGGVNFRVFAPQAKNVQVSGDFNDWQPQWLEKDEKGIFSLWVENCQAGDKYKYKLEGVDKAWREKSDPYGFFTEIRPRNASVVYDFHNYQWHDEDWLSKRDKNFERPLNIYELHPGSWKKHPNGNWYSYDDLGEHLIPYLKEQAYTHIELMPLTEYPFDGSWGYQASGYFSATSRYGTPDELRNFIDRCHQNDIGVIGDFVAVHFVKDDFGLARFDGSPLYEYNQANQANSQWGTLNFDLGKNEVRSFLLSAVDFWLRYFHLDGLRFDAVSNLIYWQGDRKRGVNNGAIEFIKRLNSQVALDHPKVMLIAEDSSDFAGVTKSVSEGGLGFDYKWDMGWMNDTLKYYKADPIYRKAMHNMLSFSMAYFFSEKYLLPFSHDEVVHGKKTIIDKMHGNYQEKVAQVKNLYLYQYTHPGKKLNFMGNEIGHFREWDENKELDWFLLKYPVHQMLQRFTRDLNRIYLHHPALSKNDYNEYGFQWLEADNSTQSIYIYRRQWEDEVLIIVLNMLADSYENYEIGVPYPGIYSELINTERDIYGGCNMGNYQPLMSYKKAFHQQNQAIKVRIAPYAGIVFRLSEKSIQK